MTTGARRANVLRVLAAGVAFACLAGSDVSPPGSTGPYGTVTDTQAEPFGCSVRISSKRSLEGSCDETDDKGQLRFPRASGMYSSTSSGGFDRIASRHPYRSRGHHRETPY